jgi:hypothetical protein
MIQNDKISQNFSFKPNNREFFKIRCHQGLADCRGGVRAGKRPEIKWSAF